MIPELEDMSRKPSPKQVDAVNLRVDAELSAYLQDGLRAVTLMAQVNGDDAPDMSRALRRFLRVGLDVTFSKLGGRPQSEADWAALEESLAQQSNKH